MCFEQCTYIFISLINTVTLPIHIQNVLQLWFYQNSFLDFIREGLPQRFASQQGDVSVVSLAFSEEEDHMFLCFKNVRVKIENERNAKQGGFWPEQLIGAVEIVKDSKDTITLVELQMVEIVSLEKKIMDKRILLQSQILPPVMGRRGGGSRNVSWELREGQCWGNTWMKKNTFHTTNI